MLRLSAAALLFRDTDFDRARVVEAGAFNVCSNGLTDADIAAATL